MSIIGNHKVYIIFCARGRIKNVNGLNYAIWPRAYLVDFNILVINKTPNKLLVLVRQSLFRP